MTPTDQPNPPTEGPEARAVAMAAEVEDATRPTVEPRAEVVPIDMAEPDERALIEARIAELDLSDTSSIIKFGSGAQSKLTEISDSMLEGVRNKDTGPAGESLRDMVSTIRGFDVDELNPNAKQSWWEKLIGRVTPVAQFVAEYEDVRAQLDKITDELLRHETILMKDVKFLDRLYEETLSFYDELGLYISAGEARLDRLDVFDIPAAEKEAQNAEEGEGAMAAQGL
ncbi:MAG: toxic anion resistance protein, partial [Pseudomonadota bacterium]